MKENDPKINIPEEHYEVQSRRLRVLVAPLDWGLGHATRCIPVIKELIRQNFEVWLAGEGAQEALLREEFPSLPFLHLPGYRVQYAKTGRGLKWSLLKQLLRIRKVIRQEHRWLASQQAVHNFNVVISDNRYGVHHPGIHSILVTHQLRIQTGAMPRWVGDYLQRLTYRFIDRFNVCFVPDFAGDDNLAGSLAHPGKLPHIPVKYIGLLSRFDRSDQQPKKNHLLVLLSGPEPQRSLLEEIILRDIVSYPYTATIVRGLPGDEKRIPSTNMITFYNHLSANELGEQIAAADLVIMRSGYSSLMDMLTLQKKTILIPTPGQTEQEYLAELMQEKKYAPFVKQKSFRLDVAINMATNFSYQLPKITNGDALKKAIISVISDS